MLCDKLHALGLSLCSDVSSACSDHQVSLPLAPVKLTWKGLGQSGRSRSNPDLEIWYPNLPSFPLPP
jgi:hypothetical protein